MPGFMDSIDRSGWITGIKQTLTPRLASLLYAVDEGWLHFGHDSSGYRPEAEGSPASQRRVMDGLQLLKAQDP